jgi:hypothetical protein
MTMTLDGSLGVTFNDASLQPAAASPYVLKNKIINGSMQIDQRNAGASVTNTTASLYTIDRWAIYGTVASKFTAQQNAASVTPPTGFTNYLGNTSSSAYSVTSTDIFMCYQIIEGYNIADLGWGTANAKTITLSFQVRSSLTGTFGGVLSNGTYSYPFTYTISSANTWTPISVTIAGQTAGTWNTTNTTGMILRFSIGCGSTYLGTANTWANTDYYGAIGQTNVVGTNGATFYITGVQLEVGSTATPFERRLYNHELANCQRYYFKTTPMTGNQPAYGVIGSLSTTRSISMNPVPMPVTMRTTPTVGYYSLAITNASTSTISSTMSSVTAYNSTTSSNYVTLDVNYTAGGSATNVYCLSASAAGSYLDFSAEL